MANKISKIAVLETVLFALAIVAMWFLNFRTSDQIIIFAILVIFGRIVWLFHNKELNISEHVLKNYKLFSGWTWYGAVFIVSLAMLIVFANKVQNFPSWLTDKEPLWFTFFHTGAQELIFRTYLLNRLQAILKNPFAIAAIGGLLFGLTHFILPNASDIVLLTAILGIIWCYIYQKYPNFLLVWLSHLILNLTLKYLAS